MSTRKFQGEWFGFESHGVAVGVSSRDSATLSLLEERLRTSFPANDWKLLRTPRKCHRFSIRRNAASGFVMFEGRRKITEGSEQSIFVNFMASRIRLHVAEFSPRFVFIHAGVVEWKDRAIVIPARSFSGKTSLVKELVRLGACYYSDEYAVIGEDGLVRPFASPLGIRKSGEWEQTDANPEDFGVVGTAPVEIGMIVHTAFESGADFEPVEISRGEGILEMLSQTISMTYRPEFTLKLLNLATSRAIILKSIRGEAARAARKILKLLEKQMS